MAIGRLIAVAALVATPALAVEEETFTCPESLSGAGPFTSLELALSERGGLAMCHYAGNAHRPIGRGKCRILGPTTYMDVGFGSSSISAIHTCSSSTGNVSECRLACERP